MVFFIGWLKKATGKTLNLQLKADTLQKRRENKRLSWAEQEHTINEVGSTYTIQGFDFNYAGLIIRPSVKFRDGRVIFNKRCK